MLHLLPYFSPLFRNVLPASSQCVTLGWKYMFPLRTYRCGNADLQTSGSCKLRNPKSEVRNPQYGLHLSFVRRGAVDRWNRDVVQPQIDRELAAMMHDVVHHERAHRHRFRHREIDLLAVSQRPRFEKLLIRGIFRASRAPRRYSCQKIREALHLFSAQKACNRILQNPARAVPLWALSN